MDTRQGRMGQGRAWNAGLLHSAHRIHETSCMSLPSLHCTLSHVQHLPRPSTYHTDCTPSCERPLSLQASLDDDAFVRA